MTCIRDACGRTRGERIRDLARELGRSETAIWRQWIRLSYGVETIPFRDPWKRIEDADDADCGVILTAEEVSLLARDRFSRRAALPAERPDDGEESP